MTKAYSITQASKLHNITRQGIYIAIKTNRLKAMKTGNVWRIDHEDFREYQKNRYSRKFSKYEGQLVYDKDKGEISIPDAAKMLSLPEQKLYYALRAGYLKASKKRSAWVIHIDDLWRYWEFFKKQARRRRSRRA